LINQAQYQSNFVVVDRIKHMKFFLNRYLLGIRIVITQTRRLFVRSTQWYFFIQKICEIFGWMLNLGRRCGDRKKNMNYASLELIWLSGGGFEFSTGKRLNFNQHIKWLFFNVYY